MLVKNFQEKYKKTILDLILYNRNLFKTKNPT